MGDRGNIAIRQDGTEEYVWLYSHWSGFRLPDVLQAALKRKLRWSDTPYLARIIFCEMIKGQETGETGYGISTQITDNQYPVLVVDPEAQAVSLVARDRAEKGDLRVALKTWPMAEYIKLDLETHSLLELAGEVV